MTDSKNTLSLVSPFTVSLLSMHIFFFVLAFIVLTIVVSFIVTKRVDKKIEAGFSPQGHFTPVKGGVIHWAKQGDGPALVLVHGLAGNTLNFSALTKRLAQQYTVYSIDRPGSGFSKRERDTSASFEKQSEMIVEWMDSINLEKAFFVGHSMGGGISLRLALDAPEKIAGVTLLCPLTAPLTGGAGPLSMLYIPNERLRKFIAKSVATPYRMKVGKKHMAQIFAPEPVPTDFATKGGGALALHSECFFHSSSDTVAAQKSLYKQVRQYEDISCPVGILYGEKDAILDPKSQMPPVTTTIKVVLSKTLPGAGHMIPITQPDACMAFINETNKLVSVDA